MTDTNQKLREAFESRMTDNGKWPNAIKQGRNGCYLLAQTENAWTEWQACAEALAMPTAEQVDDINVAESFTSVTKTAATVGERDAFERTMMDKYGWQRNDFKLDDFGYADGQTDTAWMAWQARAALSAGDAQRLDFIEQSARCDPKMDGQHVWWPTSFNTAQLLKGPTLREAIDNAIRARKDNT